MTTAVVSASEGFIDRDRSAMIIGLHAMLVQGLKESAKFSGDFDHSEAMSGRLALHEMRIGSEKMVFSCQGRWPQTV